MTAMQVFRSTVIILLTLISAYILLISGRIIIVLFIAIVIASAIRPLVQALTRFRIPLGIAIFLVYLLLALIIVTIAVAILPPLVNQVATYIENDWRLSAQIISAQRAVEHFISDMAGEPVVLVAPEEIREAVSNMVRDFRLLLPSLINDVGATLGDAILILVMGAYWLTSHERATETVLYLSPPRFRGRASDIVREVEVTMGSYVRGVATISTIVFSLNLAVYTLIGVPNGLTLAFIIGVATSIPMIGGLIGGFLATVIALVTSPTNALIVFATFFVINQIENYLLTPRIMGRSVALDPLLVIVYTAIGFVMFGITGALIAVPVMGTVHILITRLVVEPYTASIQRKHVEEGVPLFITDPDQASEDHPPTPKPLQP